MLHRNHPAYSVNYLATRTNPQIVLGFVLNPKLPCNIYYHLWMKFSDNFFHSWVTGFHMIVVPWPMVVIVAPLTNSVLTIGPSVIKIFNKFFLFLHLCFKIASGHLYNPVNWHKTRSNGVVNPGKFRNTRLVHTFCCVKSKIKLIKSIVQSKVQSKVHPVLYQMRESLASYPGSSTGGGAWVQG